MMLAAAALGACAAPKLVTPRVEHASYAELVQNQPDCTVFLEELEAQVMPTHEIVLATLWCYRGVWKFWEGNFRILDAQIRAMELEDK